jgi:hypothetical protein
MPGFLNSLQEKNIADLFGVLHNTFAREVTIYKNAKKIMMSSSSQYNSIYGKNNTGLTPQIKNESISKKFNARIYYINSEEEVLSSDGSQNKIILPKGSVKIIIDSTAFEFVKESRRVEFDGKRFAIKSDGNPSGFTYNQFYTFYLTPIDE